MKISACIIAKNEEKNLPRLLESIKGKFDEIILVDTGSTDKTVEIAKSYGCKVYHRKWKGFADARNYAVSKASGEWIWHFDADFELEEQEWKKALFYLKHLPKEIDAVAILIKNISSDDNAGISSNTFIHRNKPDVRWVGKVHETVNVSESAGIPVFVKHYGYQNYECLQEKANRNLQLIEEELKNINPSKKDYYIKLFYLVQSYSIIAVEKTEYWEKVIRYSEEFLSKVPEDIKFFSTYIYVYLIRALIQKKMYEKAQKRLKEALQKFPDYPDILFIKAELYMRLKNYDKASEGYLKFIQLIDRHLNNPFILSKGTAFVSDKLGALDYYMDKDIIDAVQNSRNYNLKRLIEIWKEEKGEYLGILILKLAVREKEKITKIVKKLINIYNTPKLLSQALLYSVSVGDTQISDRYGQ